MSSGTLRASSYSFARESHGDDSVKTKNALLASAFLNARFKNAFFRKRVVGPKNELCVTDACIHAGVSVETPKCAFQQRIFGSRLEFCVAYA